MPGVFISYRRQDSQSASVQPARRGAPEVSADGNRMRAVVVDAATRERDVLTMHRIQ